MLCGRWSGEKLEMRLCFTTQSWLLARVCSVHAQLVCMFAIDRFLNMWERHNNQSQARLSQNILVGVDSQQLPPGDSHQHKLSNGMEGSQPTLFGAERHASLRWWPGQQRPSCGNQQHAWPNSGWWSPLNWCYQGEALHLAGREGKCTCQWGMHQCWLANC